MKHAESQLTSTIRMQALNNKAMDTTFFLVTASATMVSGNKFSIQQLNEQSGMKPKPVSAGCYKLKHAIC